MSAKGYRTDIWHIDKWLPKDTGLIFDCDRRIPDFPQCPLDLLISCDGGLHCLLTPVQQCDALHYSPTVIQSYSPTVSVVDWSDVECSAVQCSAVEFSEVQFSAVQCSSIQCSVMQCTTQSICFTCSELQESRVLSNPISWGGYVIFSTPAASPLSNYISSTVDLSQSQLEGVAMLVVDPSRQNTPIWDPQL